MSDPSQVELAIAEASLNYVQELEKANRTYLGSVVRLEIERRLKAEARTIVAVVYIVVGISLTFAILTTGIVRGGVAYALMAAFGWTFVAVGNRFAAHHVSRHLDQQVLERVGHADLAASETYANIRRAQLLASPKDPHQENPS